jgi:hypothetical protein
MQRENRESNSASPKAVLGFRPSCAPRTLLPWSGQWKSNPHFIHGKDASYRWTMAAWRERHESNVHSLRLDGVASRWTTVIPRSHSAGDEDRTRPLSADNRASPPGDLTGMAAASNLNLS